MVRSLTTARSNTIIVSVLIRIVPVLIRIVPVLASICVTTCCLVELLFAELLLFNVFWFHNVIILKLLLWEGFAYPL